MSKGQRSHQELNESITPHVPSHAWRSTVAIVLARSPAVYHIGSGILFQIADCHFVVTAGHVIRPAYDRGKTIGIGALDGANLIATAGDWMCSVPSEESDRDPYDVALYRFPPEAVEKLRGMRFLRIGDTSFDDPGPTAIYSLFGFPGLWSEPTHTPHERLTVKALAARGARGRDGNMDQAILAAGA